MMLRLYLATLLSIFVLCLALATAMDKGRRLPGDMPCELAEQQGKYLTCKGE